MKTETKVLVGFVLGVLLAIAGGCAKMDSARHNYVMRGQILDITDDGVYLCIGSEDGAVVGQEYEVYQFVKTGNVKSLPFYKKENTGTVKLTEITDEHYAKAKIVAGVAKLNQIVELKQ